MFIKNKPRKRIWYIIKECTYRGKKIVFHIKALFRK